MEQRPMVVLLGESLLMDGVAASLAGKEMLGTVRMNSHVKDIREHLETLQPDLVIFELDEPESPFLFSLLREQPGILLIGLDLACSRAIVLNSRQQMTRTMSELCLMVQAEAVQKARLPKGGEPVTDD